MGKPELGSCDQVVSPRSLAERLKAEANGHAAPIEGTTASFMAERFAPEVAPLGANDADLDAPPGKMPEESTLRGLITAPAEQTSPVRWALLAILVFVALAPAIALAALYWRGAIDVPAWAEMLGEPRNGQAPEVQQASIASMAAPETVLPKRDIELPSIALSLPDMIAAEAGKEAPFAIGLDEMDQLPARSILTIRGLPEGTSFSSGRPYGATEWTLRPDEIGDLRLVLPATASGERALSVELVAADGRMIATASTKLEIADDPKVAVIRRPEDTARIDELMAHGRKMVEVGYVAGARGYFRRAADAGSAEAAFALGATYDPSFIEEIGGQGIKPDVRQARIWYERATALGDKDAHAQLMELAKTEAVAMQTPGAAEAPAAAQAANAPSSAEAREAEWVEVSGAVNVRSAPTSQAEAIKVAEQGTRYQATGRQGRWVQVTDPKTSEVGWIYSRYVAPSEAPSQ